MNRSDDQHQVTQNIDAVSARYAYDPEDVANQGGTMHRWKPLLAGLLLLNCLGIFWIWGTALGEGAFAAGLFRYQLEGNIPIFHLTAELGMAILTAVGVVGWWGNWKWGRILLTLG
jgi:hypothetical protein